MYGFYCLITFISARIHVWRLGLANLNAASNGCSPLLANIELQPLQLSQEQGVAEDNAAFTFGFFPSLRPDVVPGMMSTSSSMGSAAERPAQVAAT